MIALTTTYAQKIDRLRAGIGTSDDPDATDAGTAAATAATARLDGQPIQLVLVYASVQYDLARLLAAINDVTGGAPLVGATSSGQLHNGDLTMPGEGVAVLVLAGGDYRFGVGQARNTRIDPVTAGQDLARSALEAGGGADQRAPYEVLLVLAGGPTPDPQELLNGVYKVTGFAVPVVGGVAGDDRQIIATYVFVGGEVLNDAAVGVWISSPRPLTVASGHGWQPTSLPLLVTDVDGQVVRELGGRPAVDVYREHFRHANPADEVQTPRGTPYHSAHAFGLIQPDGSLLIRAALVDGDRLMTFSPLPQYAAVQVMSGDVDELLAVGAQTVREATDSADPAVVLIFDCVARLDALGGRGPEEAAMLQRAAGPARTFGFYTYGEFARTNTIAGYHNATITAIAL